MKTPKVSLIIPCYGVEKYLARCLQSVVNQTLKDIEIILVDDESPDKVPQMCDEWAEKDPRIKVIHKKNGGLGLARNSGLEIATGEYVGFIDSDDYVEPDTYAKTYEESIANNLDVCFFQFRRFSDDGKVWDGLGPDRSQLFIGRQQVDEYLFNMVGADPIKPRVPHVAVSVWCGLYKMEAIRKSGIRFISEREVASEDLIFHTRFLPKTERIGVLPNRFYNYYKNSSSITSTFNNNKRKALKMLVERLKFYLDENYDDSTYHMHYISCVLRTYKLLLCFEVNSSLRLSEKWKLLYEECCDKQVQQLYGDFRYKKFSLGNRLFIECLKLKIVPFFLILYYFRKNH